MAAFDPSAELSAELDFRLLRNTCVTLFWDPAILTSTIAWLGEHGYRTVEIDAARWTREADLHRDIAAALDFPDHYGKNLDALNDCLRDVASGDYGADLGATGFVLVLRHYDKFATAQARASHALLDIYADQARGALLIGHRMMCLVQSDDPRLSFPTVGALSVTWNDAEWLDSKRGL
ncbi:barstar family protein [Amycolatopsis sp. NPDC051372]|uniref:barstar family protein n=1 Tax=unclassified Amycolatopsis TaxID=2618356 RepID=UPI003447713E